MVNNLQHAFDRSTKKYFDQTSSDEEPVLLEYPPIDNTGSRFNVSKEKDDKKEKFKPKENKHSKQNSKNRSGDEDEDDSKNVEEKVTLKKSKSAKHKSMGESIEKIDKKIPRSASSDKKKEKSTKGVKRKHKDKDKSEKPKTKKMRKDLSDDENEDFEFNSDKSKEEKTIEKIPKQSFKSDNKSKKSEVAKQPSVKGKVKPLPQDIRAVVSDTKKKPKKECPTKSEKFSKTNEKANIKKRKLETCKEEVSDSNSENFHDLIEDKKTSVNYKKVDLKKSKEKPVNDNGKKPPKKVRAPTSTPKKNNKKNLIQKTELKKRDKKKEEDLFSTSSASFSRSPSPLPSIRSSAVTEDLTNSFDNDNDNSKSSRKILDSSFRSDTPEIKDKFDLIKERRNKINQEKEKAKKKDHSHHSASHTGKEKNHKLKETIEKLKIKNEKSKSQIEFMDEVLGGKVLKKESSNLFDKLKNEEIPIKAKNSVKKKTENLNTDVVKVKNKKSKSEKVEEKTSTKAKPEEKQANSTVQLNSSNQNSKNKKQQNKQSLDVLDMETEQTLKDINKWLEHTPRFEYSSASNSPSRYIIDEIDMPSKMDDNDFRKPIPLMPSSPSASHSNFQSPKDLNLLKESNNNKQASSSQHSLVATTSNKKAGSKEPKRKSLKEKLQQLPRKKEVQRTIDRLQPGKTKGNLLHNIQNINKPEEFFPLGNREVKKEVKNSLIVQTDESSPKLSLGTVLDTQAFNFNENDKKQDNECFDEIKIEGEDDKMKTDEEDCVSKPEEDCEDPSSDANRDSKEVMSKDSDKKMVMVESGPSKPNLNAWFKAFGVPKKPKKSESQEEAGKMSDHNDSLKTEGSYLPSHHRRLSTGSSMSERSSVEDSPQVGLEERLGAPAPYPSPIGASPVMASPKTEDALKASSSNYVNGSVRAVGFYQDMTSSTKSSPEKSCSPREMPSPYGQYSQQHLYSGTGVSTSSSMYGNFYNPENSSANKTAQQQASYSKPTTSPASYYDQYKQPLSQESDFNNSMSPSTNPNSPYHSQQSSPYQQQPNSPFQSPAAGNGNTGAIAASISQSPNSPYSQPNSTYANQQSQAQITPFHQSSSSAVITSSQTQKTTSQNQSTPFMNQNSAFPQISQNSSFNQLHQTGDSFPPATPQQSCSKTTEWINKQPNASSANNTYNLNSQQSSNNFMPTQQPQSHHQNIQAPQIISQNTNAQQHQSQHMLTAENSFPQNPGNYIKKPSSEPQSSGTPSTTPLYGTSKLPDMANVGYGGIDMVTKGKDTSNVNKQIESSKYLDLSKQQAAHMNQQQPTQYQQMFDLSNYNKVPSDFDTTKNKTAEMYNRSIQKNSNPVSASSCAGLNVWGNSNSAKSMEPTGANFVTQQNEASKIELVGKQAANSLPGNSFLNNPVSHQQTNRNTQPVQMDINYKQPIFNNPAASSMMDLTAFMRDFRQAEERFSSLSGSPGSFYDKNITPAHMFGKNLQQANSSAALQQMFNNSMTTMAYNREQQNMNLASYHNRLNAPQGAIVNTNQTHNTVTPQSETKVKKQRKKKNASPEISANVPVLNQQLHPHSQHQQLQQQQQLAHQQSFQSYSGLKIPSATAGPADPSAISLKSVVPGSAFNYGPTPLTGLYGESPAYLDEFRGTPNPYYPPPPGLGHRSTPDPAIDKSSNNPPPAHPQAPSSPYHHLLPPTRSSYPFMNSIDPAALQQQYRMMLNQTYQAGYHPALGMHNQPPHWPHHM